MHLCVFCRCLIIASLLPHYYLIIASSLHILATSLPPTHPQLLNPSEVFGDIMIDYDYVELTSACITALASFHKAYPDRRADEVRRAIDRGARFVRRIQRNDGSWYGSWGVCFTYGTWFGCCALAAVGEDVRTSSSLRSAVDFLLHKQRADGGWAESYLSSQNEVYSQSTAETSHVVNTAWALLALMTAGYHHVDVKPIVAGVRFLLRMQEASGDWPQQSISGVFNKNCMITYANYRCAWRCVLLCVTCSVTAISFPSGPWACFARTCWGGQQRGRSDVMIS